MSEQTINYFWTAHAPPAPEETKSCSGDRSTNRRSAFYRVQTAGPSAASINFRTMHTPDASRQYNGVQQHMNQTVSPYASSSSASCVSSTLSKIPPSLNSTGVRTTHAASNPSVDTLAPSTAMIASSSDGSVRRPMGFREHPRMSPELRSKFHKQCSLLRKRSREDDDLLHAFNKRKCDNDVETNSDMSLTRNFAMPSQSKRVRQNGSNFATSQLGKHSSNHELWRNSLSANSTKNSSSLTSENATGLSAASCISSLNSLPSTLNSSAPPSPQISNGSSLFLKAQQHLTETNARLAPRKRQRCPQSQVDRPPSLFHRPWEAYPTELEKKYQRSSTMQGHSGRRRKKSARRSYES